jgi:hypothetical protein
VNNSFERLIDGMIEALRHEIIPHTEGDYPRGQAYGVIFLLQSLKLRADWSPVFLQEQLEALDELQAALARIDGLPANAPRPGNTSGPGNAPLPVPGSGASPKSMQVARDAGDQRVCDLIDWLQRPENSVSPAIAKATHSAIDTYLRRQLRHEIKTSAKPMFAALSLGREVD